MSSPCIGIAAAPIVLIAKPTTSFSKGCLFIEKFLVAAAVTTIVNGILPPGFLLAKSIV